MIPSVDTTPWWEVKSYTEDDSISEKSSISNYFVLLEKWTKPSTA